MFRFLSDKLILYIVYNVILILLEFKFILIYFFKKKTRIFQNIHNIVQIMRKYKRAKEILIMKKIQIFIKY